MYYYHNNAHGDVIAVTDSNGNVYRQYVYDPYGNIISVKDGSGTSVNLSTDSFNNAYLYAGYRYDSESGLYYLNARYYAPGIGRFLTKDTFKGLSTDSQSLNQYAYTEGDPINSVDPSGHYEDETGDPNHPFATPGAGQADTGKLEFKNYGSAIVQGGAEIVQGGTKNSRDLSKVTKDYSPHYRSYTISVGEVVGLGITYTTDRDGNNYLSIHADLGKTYTLVSGSIVDGYIYNDPNIKDLSSFIRGWSRNASYGFIGGVGITVPVGSNLKAIETGGYIPQYGVSQGYTWLLPW